VALTLDFGGRVGDALAIVRYLADRGVPATVFSTGAQADLAAGDAVVRQVFEVVCAPGGLFAIGNHSMTHPDFATLRPKQMREELAAAEAAIDRACPGRSTRPLFRPPFGSLGGWQTATFYRILDAVGAAGYSRTVAWDVDTLDWAAPGTDRHQTAAQIVARVQAKVRGGSIVLMHLGGYETYDALRILVPWLRGQGFELVTLAEMPGL